MTRRNLLLQLLTDAGERGVTTADLLQAGVGARYSARLLELREQGYVISSERLREGSWRYVLLNRPAVSSVSGQQPPPTSAAAAHGVSHDGGHSSPQESPSPGTDETVGQLFPTADQEFDHMVPPLSPYDAEAA